MFSKKNPTHFQEGFRLFRPSRLTEVPLLCPKGEPYISLSLGKGAYVLAQEVSVQPQARQMLTQQPPGLPAHREVESRVAVTAGVKWTLF